MKEIRVPHLDTYNFGLGVDSLSGAARNRAVEPKPEEPYRAAGVAQSLEVSRVTSTRQLQESLGLSVEASGGSAAFGGGVSARFSFSEKSEIQSSSLFMVISATVHFADLSIPECVMTQGAGDLVGNPAAFTTRYGDSFLRACRRGGLFAGVLRVETADEEQSRTIEAELQGSYGLFSAEAESTFSSITKNHNCSVYCSLYTEGGPAVAISDPRNPAELIQQANHWMQAMHEDPDAYSRPYQWTIVPMGIAEGPLPPNPVDLEHAQDVLKFCVTERAAALDQLNLLRWWSRHPDLYDFTGATSLDQVRAAASAMQADLDLIADCASDAMNHPLDATFPSDFANKGGAIYPSAQMPAAPRRLATSIGSVEIFTHADYADMWQDIPGFSDVLAIGRYDDLRNTSVGNDGISALKVPAGLTVRCYEHGWFGGAYIDYSQDTPKVPMIWNDKCSSLIVFESGGKPPEVDFVSAFEYKWSEPALLKIGDYRDLAETSLSGKPIGVLLVPEGLQVRLYAETDLGGDFLDIPSNGLGHVPLDTAEMPLEWQNRAASLSIRKIAL